MFYEFSAIIKSTRSETDGERSRTRKGLGKFEIQSRFGDDSVRLLKTALPKFCVFVSAELCGLSRSDI